MKSKTILVIGRGGREHALVWKLAQSPQVERVFVAPGNGGTALAGGKIGNVALSETDFDRLIDFARQCGVDLTVVGPETPLAEGIVDAFEAAGLRCFGPVRAAAQIEASKAFAKDFMSRHGIPTARYATFADFDAALAYVQQAGFDVVIKASGLAAGKGVILPASEAEAEAALRQVMLQREFGAAGDQVVIEERLTGPEASVLAFSDGRSVAVMPAAQDHKRVFDGDQGPNTGGMGAYAPAPLMTPSLLDDVRRVVLQSTVDGLRAEGTPYVGVLYAGLMMAKPRYGGDAYTIDDVRVLEFNCRFGDPETQAILPLLESDLVDVIEACLDGMLDHCDVRWRSGAAATVVAASEGYPGSYPKGRAITGLGEAAASPGVVVFHAGTRLAGDGRLLTDGGRVLAVTGVGDDLPTALSCAYAGLDHIHFDGIHFRRDIGQKAHHRILCALCVSVVNSSGDLSMTPVSYRDAGVDIAAGARAVELMKDAVRATYGPEVLLGIGAFGGLFDVSALKGMDAPVLVASTDGVGTKTKIASALGRFDTIGFDIVNHCVNDILVQGARPLFFLDYIASSQIDPAMVAAVVGGCAAACQAAGCALLGGETAEMPGVYAAGEFDLVGAIVGAVDRSRIIDGSRIAPGDSVIGLASAGLHTNGFSLARRVLQGWDLEAVAPELGRPLGEALLAPHRSYLPHIQQLQGAGVDVKGLAHITGGGLIDNPPRSLCVVEGTAVHLQRGSWPVPPLFQLIQRAGQIADAEMAHVFNLGLGMLVAMPADQAEQALAVLDDAWLVGKVVAGDGQCVIGET